MPRKEETQEKSRLLWGPKRRNPVLPRAKRCSLTARVLKHSVFRRKPEYAALLTEREARFADVTPEALAAQFGYSRRQIIRIIQDCTGQRFTQLQTRLRMEKAARMRKAGAASVEDIGLAVGYSDRACFYRAFKKHFGCTPKAYCQGRRPPLTKGSLF